MTQEHPITPPPELVKEWASALALGGQTDAFTQAARWGADQELEACCELVRYNDGYDAALALRADRRPKPPSLKAQALEELDLLKGDANAHGLGFDAPAIRRAIESLPD